MSMDGGFNETAAALLEWYREAGIDVVVSDIPRDRFAETATEATRRGAPASSPMAARRDGSAGPANATADSAMPPAQRSSAPSLSSMPSAATTRDDSPGSGLGSPRVTVPDEVAVADARERARSAQSLEELEAALARFEGCNLRLTARSLVFGDGDPRARLMLIGEAPGREEDIAGHPFVGRSGQLLNRMLGAIGIERDSVRVTNTVPWRPPGNRPPTPMETEICRPFIERQIELVKPDILVCLGSPAAKAILGAQEGIMRLRGQWRSYVMGLDEGQAIPTLAMLHPAYLLRQPSQKRLAWRDLQSLKQRLDGLPPRA
ncbi:uracil-DNA glycosylase [Mangrovicella endophytica]|uniref:uracil-DNA glycosylase n=1 Tax=Mangrovicella endophytica TaxID=2066697 RepID=UPI000C9E9013|nr:uracil-DNA glycosylase [Mangrovicella endophytica]